VGTGFEIDGITVHPIQKEYFYISNYYYFRLYKYFISNNTLESIYVNVPKSSCILGKPAWN
jgi:hypothetical protein